jgi:hypothetical protein
MSSSNSQGRGPSPYTNWEAASGGRSRGGFVPLLSGRRGVIAGLAVRCNAMRRQRLAIAIGQVRSLPGDGRPSPPASRRRAPASPCRDSSADASSAEGRRSQGGVLVGGGRGCVTRHLSPWRWGTNRAATPGASAQLQHPRQVGPPSPRPIRPKLAAISRLFAKR